MKFRKSVLLEDRKYRAPGGVLDVNPDSRKAWVEKFSAITGQKHDIPVMWNHQDDPNLAKPIYRKGKKRSRAEGQAGWLTNVAVGEQGGLELEFDIPNQDDAQKVKDNVTKVSPVIWENLTLGKDSEEGPTTFEDFIGSCDLVLHPVDDTQTDFEPVEESIACSVVRMSAEGPSIIHLGDAPEGDAPDDDDEPADARMFTAVMEALPKINIMLPDSTTAETFLENFAPALLTAVAMLGESEDDTQEVTPETIQMSTEETKDVVEETPEQKYGTAQKKEQIKLRLSALFESGRCFAHERDEREPLIVEERLNLSAEGIDAPSDLEKWIESREALPEGSCWSSEQKLKLSAEEEEVPQPNLSGEVTPEEAKQMADSILGVSK